MGMKNMCCVFDIMYISVLHLISSVYIVSILLTVHIIFNKDRILGTKRVQYCSWNFLEKLMFMILNDYPTKTAFFGLQLQPTSWSIR